MGKKATKTASWRTLMRRAEGAKPAEAKKLRDRAAAMRREERATAKKPATAGKVRKVARKRRVGATKADIATAQRVANDIASNTLNNLKREARRYEAHEPIFMGGVNQAGTVGVANTVDATIATHVRAIMVDARKKKLDPEHAIAQRIGNIMGVARYEGQQEADRQHMKAMRNAQRGHTSQVVRGFLAQIQIAEQKYSDGIPHMSLNSYTIARIVDALHAAGWSPHTAPDDFFET